MFARSIVRSKTIKYGLSTASLLGAVTGTMVVGRLSLDSETHSDESMEYYRRRSNSSLMSSLFVYTVTSSPLLVALGKATIRTCDTLGTPGIYSTIARGTFYAQFCGGETCEEVERCMRSLRQESIGVILAYAREEADTTEEAFDRVLADTFETIDVAARLPNNFVALKLTALADPRSLRACSRNLRSDAHRKQAQPVEHEDKAQMLNLERRVFEIMDHAVKKGVKVLIDAEQDHYQGVIEDLTMKVYRKYNRMEAMAYGTYQCYLKTTAERLRHDMQVAKDEGWILGVKLVRGAYIASEPRHLIHDTKLQTDRVYDDAVRVLLSDRNVETMIATHNQDSIDAAVASFPPASPVAFSQLYGMGAPMTHSLLSTLEAAPQNSATQQGGGIRVYNYVPWGTVEESMKYLLRRADENSAMATRSKSERNDIFRELVARVRARIWT